MTSSHGLRLNIWLNCSLLESFLPTDSSLYEISDSRLQGFNWCFFICSSLHFRKRIQGFCLLCVSVWPLRGPWFQLRWSAQCIWGNMSRHINIQLRLIHHTTNTQNTFRLNLLIEPLSKKLHMMPAEKITNYTSFSPAYDCMRPLWQKITLGSSK